MRIAIVGGVSSTSVLLETVLRHGFKDVKVWGYEPNDKSRVSGWSNLRRESSDVNVNFEAFRKVSECEPTLMAFQPDVLFVVGLSQIVPASMLNIASRVNVGFHPTPLPKGRGRAALAWLILTGMNGAATFFELRYGVDDGPIFVQESFSIEGDDDVGDVETKLLAAEKRALDRWLPRLSLGDFSAIDQDHLIASWFGRRTPEDGWIDWSAPRDTLMRLIRASAPPHPGAYTYFGDTKVDIFRAKISDRDEIGVPGRILRVDGNHSFEVQAGDALISVIEWRADRDWTPRVGQRLGFYVENEIHALRARVANLEATIADVLMRLDEKAEVRR